MDLGSLKVSIGPLHRVRTHIETIILYVERDKHWICWCLNPGLPMIHKTVHYIYYTVQASVIAV